MRTHGAPGCHRHLRRRAAVLVATVALGLCSAAVAAHADEERDQLVPGTPCTRTARACADLTGRKAWLLRDGEIVRGPVLISIGGAGRATPTGTFAVQWKNKDHRSAEFNNAPMPYAVFFAPGGIAFHEGNLQTTSAGCIRLARADAAAFYADLQVGDQVQIR